MKCPMQTVTPEVSPGNIKIDFFQCVRGECAWWYNGAGCCVIKDISGNLFLIAETLTDIKKKMPKDFAPR